MGTYGQFCPLAQAAQILCERWTLLVVRELVAGSTRFNELRRGVPRMSPALLTKRLRQLEQAGVVRRRSTRTGASYELTRGGRELRPVVEGLGTWGHRWARSRLDADELDAGLLMWDMRRTVDATRLPAGRVVVRFHYPDAPRGAREWWLICERGQTDLCLEDPGHEVDVEIVAPLRVMTSVWTCQLPFHVAERRGEVKVFGNSDLRRRLPQWLRASYLSQLGAAATDRRASEASAAAPR